jgi:hypothetical protein
VSDDSPVGNEYEDRHEFDMCPCGHARFDHQLYRSIDGRCERCNCTRFGQPEWGLAAADAPRWLEGKSGFRPVLWSVAIAVALWLLARALF